MDSADLTRGDVLRVLFGELPDPSVSWEQAREHAHLDLDVMTAAELERERARVVMWHALEDDPERLEWLGERLAGIAVLRAGGRRGR